MANYAKVVAAVLAAAAVAVPVIGKYEGYVPKGYRDPAPGGFETICYGHMEPGVLGKVYTPEKCMDLLAADAVKHGLEIAPCLPAELPVATRAAFTSFAFNIGRTAFCKSTLSRKALAGDLRGACEELPRWNKAGGKVLAGLTRRRTEERALCLSGLA